MKKKSYRKCIVTIGLFFLFVNGCQKNDIISGPQFGTLKEFKGEILDKQKNMKFRVPASRIEKLMK